MSEKAEVKPEALPDLDDLLQCPVCYEIPSGQIFQCNEGHHVCGRCKVRLDVCPVCRALFYGTRNYAMEELIANIRKLRAFKLGGKVTTGSGSSENSTPVKESILEEPESTSAADDDEGESDLQISDRSTVRPPQACKGLFRCLCCKNGNSERLPSGRLLNHLRYFHSPELIEGLSENGEYIQAWQFSTVPGRIVTAVRVSDMGIFFLTIEISNTLVSAWLTMAASPWVSHEFCYTVTISGYDREAIFSDCVWSVRSCEGSLKKRGHCLIVSGSDARALTAPESISGKLSVRRAPADQLTQPSQPRTALRVATRGNMRDNTRDHSAQQLEPFLQGLQNDVARLSRAFATLGRDTTALVRSGADMRARIDNRQNIPPVDNTPSPSESVVNNQSDDAERPQLSRNARRRLRQRMRAALNGSQSSPGTREVNNPVVPTPRQNGPILNDRVNHAAGLTMALPQQSPVVPTAANASSGPSNGLPQNANQVRTNKKKRRQRS